LWQSDIQASGYLIGTDVVRPDRKTYPYGSITPSNTTATRLWQNSARTIGDILILSDIVNPFVYHALPFSNQPFVVAGCCYIKEADAQRQRQLAELTGGVWKNFDQSLFSGNERTDHPPDAIDGLSRDFQSDANKEERAEMFRTLLQSVTSNNITALQQGLVRQTRYWAGVAWVAEVLAQRMAGISMADIDLKTVTERLDSTVAISDARMFRKSKDGSTTEQRETPATQNQLLDSSTAWFDMQLPLEADWLADTALLQSQGYPVVVEDFVSDWATNYMG
jgi:hypothetical protein